MKFAIAIVIAGLSILTDALGQALAAPLGEALWREDLQFFAKEFGATPGQKDFSKLYPRFESDLDALQADLSRLNDGEITLRLMRLVASANVAHTTVQTPNTFGFYRRLPITLYWFADGLAITAAAAEFSDAIGSRVLKMGSMTPEQLLSAMAPYISHENDVWLRERAPAFITTLAVLQHYNLIEQDGRVVFTLEKPGGGTSTLAVPVADPRTTKLTIADALHVPTVLSRSRPGQFYWFQYLDDAQTLYIQYNVCANDPKLPFEDFARQVLAEADARLPQRIVLDLRQNSGGNSRIIDRLKKGLAARSRLKGRIYVLVGPATFSSALMNALDLREDLPALLVGEPMGEKPNSYGEIKILTLPNSQLKVQYTTKFFQLMKGADLLVIQPDLPAPLTLLDARAGRDPAFEAAIAAPLR